MATFAFHHGMVIVPLGYSADEAQSARTAGGPDGPTHLSPTRKRWRRPAHPMPGLKGGTIARVVAPGSMTQEDFGLSRRTDRTALPSRPPDPRQVDAVARRHDQINVHPDDQ